MNVKPNIMVDSGAFSAFTRGWTINLKDYTDYLVENRELYGEAMNLDVIPVTESHSEEAAQDSYHNLLALLAEDLPVVPVFHYGERIYWLERLIGDGHRRIALGGIARRSHALRLHWMDRLFPILTKAKVSVHGLGVGNPRLLTRYHFDTCDSVNHGMWTATRKVGMMNERGALQSVPWREAQSLLTDDVLAEALVERDAMDGIYPICRLNCVAIRRFCARLNTKNYFGIGGSPGYFKTCMMPLGIVDVLASYATMEIERRYSLFDLWSITCQQNRTA